jgi:hypothetical protein
MKIGGLRCQLDLIRRDVIWRSNLTVFRPHAAAAILATGN